MTSPSGQRLALFVANDTYHFSGLSRLYAPVSDAEQLREVLRDPEIGGFRPTELLINESKAEIERSIERLFRGAGPDDVVLFYFSGHGIRTRQNLYLATSNTDPQLLSSSAVSSSFIRELIRDSAAAAKIILLDCCYSGAFLGNETVKAAPNIDDVGSALAAGDGICVMTASTAVEMAEDGVAGANRSAPLSVFTSAVVKGIGTGLADNGRGLISTHDLWVYVSNDVRARTSRQTPSIYGLLKDQVYVARVRRQHSQMLEIGDRVQLGDLLGRLEQVPGNGLRAGEWWGTGGLKVPIGQERRTDGAPGETVWLDLAGTDANLLVVGRSGSGKSTLLRTLVGSLALTHTEEEAQIYVLESSNRLGSMSALPHIVAVAGDDEPERVTAVLDRIAAEIIRRKQLYRKHSIDSPGSLRVSRRLLNDGPVADIFLLLDRWGDFAELMPQVEAKVRQLASAGPEYGVHVVATVRDWTEVPDWMFDRLSAHLEMRLHRPAESRVNPERAARLPDGPGWALFGQRPFRVAMPDLRELQPEITMVPGFSDDGAADLVSRLVRALPIPGATTASRDPWRETTYRPTTISPGDVPRRFAAARKPRVPRVSERIQSNLYGDVDFASLFGIQREDRVDVGALWRPRRGRNRLRLPVGVDQFGDPVALDIKESAENGMGPHGLVVGATGAGKSELLKAIVTGLAVTHSPEAVNFLLIDFKRDAGFNELASLPHVCGVVTNLVEDLTLVDRIRETIDGEVNRRLELLRGKGDFANVADYENARDVGVTLEPLPALVIVIDEFAGLLSEVPEFVETLITVARLGRSLWVHLLVATYRLDEQNLHGLENQLTYRIALRTFSARESTAVMGTSDAYQLPRAPGHGYLTTDGNIVRFKAPHVSRQERQPRAADSGGAPQRTLLEVLVAQLSQHGPTARPVWLPPLTTAPTLGMVLPENGFPPSAATMPIFIGLVDLPYWQRQNLLDLELAGKRGNVAVVGGAGAGKSTALKSIVLSAAAMRPPEFVQFYVFDFGGGNFAEFADLPHVGSVAGLLDLERVRRTIAELTALLGRRERLLGSGGLASIVEIRERKLRLLTESPADPADEMVAADEFGDVFLVVDGWLMLRQQFEEFESQITALVTRGRVCGIQVICSAARWADLRPTLKEHFGTRIELRLGDPADSDFGRRYARSVPPEVPGRGLIGGPGEDTLHIMLAQPRLDQGDDAAPLDEGVRAAIRSLRDRYPDRGAPPIRLLPLEVSRAEVLEIARNAHIEQTPHQVVIGLRESDLTPLALDFRSQTHLVAFAETRHGKTTLLRNIVSGLMESATPQEVKFVVVDYRRTMLGVVDDQYSAGYSTSAITAVPMLKELADSVAERVPGQDVTVQQLRDRSWWSGPEFFVVVDDLELVITSSVNPLTPLFDYLLQAGDLGLHLIVARHSGGSARALHEPILARLRDLNANALVMSGTSDEGVMFSVRPSSLPPGRGTFVSPGSEPELVQVAQLPPVERGSSGTQGQPADRD
ncbi:type VII secretion protein EccCb [Nocardia sp. NPDC052566]|uniref:type VII secretion protein EccCb n=1 Tax=Nocardia sp. NPDC052566 TaxID=3364330 RepID=UPI0037C93439